MILWKINPKVLLCIFVSIHAYSQNTLSGTILDNFNQPIPFADILLVDEQGIITSNRSISNETGKFVLSTDLVGLYQVRIISIGFQPYNSQLIKLSQKDEISITFHN
ncbi:MAG: carboxypeptidase-like regulatory domain-containing protein, partial [Flavobacteriaceae bacterium]